MRHDPVLPAPVVPARFKESPPGAAPLAVTVRRRHLERGARRSTTACAIALALDEVFPGGGGHPDAGGAGWYVTEGQITLWWRGPAADDTGGEGPWRRRSWWHDGAPLVNAFDGGQEEDRAGRPLVGRVVTLTPVQGPEGR